MSGLGTAPERTVTRVGAALAAALALTVAAAASPAAAHNYVVDSNPQAGQTLTELPDEFFVRTNENLLQLGGDGSGFGIDVVDADGLYYGDGCVQVDGATVSTTAALGEPGDYTLVYQFVSADGHTVSDELTFTWAPEGDAQPATGSRTQPDCNGTYVRGQAPAPTEQVTPPDLSTLLWIGGAALAVILAVAGVLVATRRRPDAS